MCPDTRSPRGCFSACSRAAWSTPRSSRRRRGAARSTGAAALALFGIGTAPALLGVSVADELLARNRAFVNRLSQVFLLAMGDLVPVDGIRPRLLSAPGLRYFTLNGALSDFPSGVVTLAM